MGPSSPRDPETRKVDVLRADCGLDCGISHSMLSQHVGSASVIRGNEKFASVVRCQVLPGPPSAVAAGGAEGGRRRI